MAETIRDELGIAAAEPAANGTPPATAADPLSLYRTMRLIRAVEVEIEGMHKQGRISGSFHSSVGQEAVAAGVCASLRPSDIVTSTHRGHGHAIAKGVPVGGVFAELLGRETGVSGGRGGSMHLHHRPSGFYGENAIVAGGLPWAAGAAWARRRRGGDDIAVAFLGDGGFAQGVTHEVLLLARHWSSPCLFVCENNGLAHSMPSDCLFGKPGAIAEIAAATGIPSQFVDGRDVIGVAQAARQVTDELREIARPAFLECATFRVRPHSISDAEYRYRAKTAGEEWLTAHDPIANLRARLAPTLGGDLNAIDAEVAELIATASAEAEAAPVTAVGAATGFVYASTPPG